MIAITHQTAVQVLNLSLTGALLTPGTMFALEAPSVNPRLRIETPDGHGWVIGMGALESYAQMTHTPGGGLKAILGPPPTAMSGVRVHRTVHALCMEVWERYGGPEIGTTRQTVDA